MSAQDASSGDGPASGSRGPQPAAAAVDRPRPVPRPPARGAPRRTAGSCSPARAPPAAAPGSRAGAPPWPASPWRAWRAPPATCAAARRLVAPRPGLACWARMSGSTTMRTGGAVRCVAALQHSQALTLLHLQRCCASALARPRCPSIPCKGPTTGRYMQYDTAPAATAPDN